MNTVLVSAISGGVAGMLVTLSLVAGALRIERSHTVRMARSGQANIARNSETGSPLGNVRPMVYGSTVFDIEVDQILDQVRT